MRNLFLLGFVIFLASCGSSEEEYVETAPTEESVTTVQNNQTQNNEGDQIIPPSVAALTEIAEIPKTTEAPAEVYIPLSAWPRRGSWDGNMYFNDYLNISFAMPENWERVTDAQIAEQMEIGIQFLEGADAVDEIMEQAQTNSFMEMMAINNTTGANVTIAYQRLDDPNMTAGQFIQYYTNYHFVAAGAEVSLGEFENIQLGGNSWEVSAAAMQIAHLSINIRFFVTVQNGFARMISIVYTPESETVYEILGMLS